MGIIRSTHNVTVRFLEWTVIGLMALLMLDVSWQVISRFALSQPSAWTDELATTLMIWVASLGASIGFLRGAHLGIDYFVGLLPAGPARWARIFSLLMVALFAGAILLYGGGQLVRITLATEQLSPALGLKMGHIYLALPLGGVFVLVESLENLVREFRRGTHLTEEKKKATSPLPTPE